MTIGDDSVAMLHAQLSSVTTSAQELERAMPLVGEAIKLIRGILADLTNTLDESAAGEYAEELDRLATLSRLLRLHPTNV